MAGREAGLSVALVLATAPAWASGADPVESGAQIAQRHCARCHAIGSTGASPFPEAPPFRRIVTRYPVDHLAEALAEGIAVGHPDMPVFAFSAPMVGDLLAYLSSLKVQ